MQDEHVALNTVAGDPELHALEDGLRTRNQNIHIPGFNDCWHYSKACLACMQGESADLPLDGSDADQDLHALENALRIMEHDSRLPPATNRNNQRPSSPALHVPVSSPAVKVCMQNWHLAI